MNAKEFNFHEMSNHQDIFNISRTDRIKTANMWYEFSVYIPIFLAQLAINSKSQEVFSRLISISNEEMGDGKTELIHSKLFFNSCLENSIYISTDYKSKSLSLLKQVMFSPEKLNDEYILGIHLGLEIIANENISKLIESLGEPIRKSCFFQIHLINEDEHIRKCINNFYTFCDSPIKRHQFIKGFNHSLIFWKSFWEETQYDY